MGQFFFNGCHFAKIDDKGRFVLPQQMRLGLVENGTLDFFIGIGLGGCLSIYRQSDIDRIVAQFKEKQHIARYQKFFTLFFSTLHQATCDKIGRVNLPVNLKRAVNIEQEIVVAGVLSKIEIWPKERYEANLQHLLENRDPDGDLQEMAEEAFALLDRNVRIEEKDEACASSTEGVS